MSQAFGGGVYIVDTSAWLRNTHPAVESDWLMALASGQIIATSILAFELLRTARDKQEFMQIEDELAALHEARLDATSSPPREQLSAGWRTSVSTGCHSRMSW